MKAQKNVRVNSQKKFIYTSICNLDLREQKKQRKDICFYVETQFGKTTGRGERIHYLQRITVNLTVLMLCDCHMIQWNFYLGNAILCIQWEV